MKPPPLLLVGDEGVVGALAAAVGCGIGGLVVAGVVRVAFAQGGRLLSVAGKVDGGAGGKVCALKLRDDCVGFIKLAAVVVGPSAALFAKVLIGAAWRAGPAAGGAAVFFSVMRSCTRWSRRLAA